MKRLFVSAALLPLALAATAQAETKITTAVTTPVKTSTATAAGGPDDLTIDTAGSVRPTAAGAAVTLDSNNSVKNLGAVGFNNLDGSTGILALGGFTGSVNNTGSISLVEDYTPTDADSDGDLDGAFATGTGRFGIRVTGPGMLTGDIRNNLGGSIVIEGNDSAGIAIESTLPGQLVNQGSIAVTGDRSYGVRAGSVLGGVQITGAVTVQGEGSTGVLLDNVGGQLQLQNAITATGYRSTTRLTDATARAKLDADDLKQGGSAVRVTGDVGGGIFLDKAPADNDANNADEDGDGVADASEGNASLVTFGSAPALDLGSATRATTIGLVGVGDNAYGLVIRGQIASDGVNDGIGATALRIGQVGGGSTTVTGGVNVQGGSIVANAYGQAATAVLINAGGVVPALKNTGSIIGTQTGGLHDARAVVDLSGSLALVENQGIIRGVVNTVSGVTQTGAAVAIDLSANTTGATIRQSKLTSTSAPSITGEIRLGSGDDRVEILGGAVAGLLSFGAGADALVIDGGAVVASRIADADGRLSVAVGEGTLALANTDTVNLSSLALGAKSKLAISLDPNAPAITRLNVSGAAVVASGAEIDFNLTSAIKTATSFDVVRAGSLSVGAAGATLVGAPYLYTASLSTSANALSVSLRPKTATELGFNRSQSEAYGAVLASLGSNALVEDAFLGATTQSSLMAVYDQMLPDHSGAALVSARAISSAINDAVSGTAIRSKTGDYAVWAQEIYFHIERDREEAMGFKSQAMGLAGGMEVLGQSQALGANVAIVTDEYKDQGSENGERVVMNFLEGGLYWRLDLGGFRADVRGGLGYVRFDSDRIFTSGSQGLTASAKWDGWLAEAHAGAAYEARLGWFTAKPELSVDYLRLSEGSYSESGGGAGFDLAVDDRQGDLLTGQALLTLGARFGDESWMQPEMTVGYRAKLAGDPGATTARFAGGNPFTLTPEDIVPHGVVARLGLRGGTDTVVYSLGAGGVFDDGYKEYDVRAAVRFAF